MSGEKVPRELQGLEKQSGITGISSQIWEFGLRLQTGGPCRQVDNGEAVQGGILS